MIDYLRAELPAPHLTRPRAGALRDRGDVGGLAWWTVEIKDLINLQEAVSCGMRELAVEQANAGTPYGALVVKRRGIGDPGRQLFVCELAQAVPWIRSTQGGVSP